MGVALGVVATLQRLALSGDSAEAVQLNELQEHRPCLSPERAILFRRAGQASSYKKEVRSFR
jgi:hypothetical protein